jgi:hypothetical protein
LRSWTSGAAARGFGIFVDLLALLRANAISRVVIKSVGFDTVVVLKHLYAASQRAIPSWPTSARCSPSDGNCWTRSSGRLAGGASPVQYRPFS